MVSIILIEFIEQNTYKKSRPPLNYQCERDNTGAVSPDPAKRNGINVYFSCQATLTIFFDIQKTQVNSVRNLNGGLQQTRLLQMEPNYLLLAPHHVLNLG